MTAIRLEIPGLGVTIEPEAGAKIVAIDDEAGSWIANYDWRSPLPATDGASYGDSQADWLSAYRGGWQVLFPNAGAACRVDGVELPFHGEVSTARWRVEDHTTDSVVLSSPSRLPLTITRQFRLIAEPHPRLEIVNTVANESDVPQSYVLVEHAGFICPRGAVVDVPAAEFGSDEHVDGPDGDIRAGSAGRWPWAESRADGEKIDASEWSKADRVSRLLYLSGLRAGWAALRIPDSERALAMCWDVESMPYLWLWQERHTPGFPWYGRSDVAGIEPASFWPSDGLAGARSRGMALAVEPHATRASWISVSGHTGVDRAVAGVGRDGVLAGS